MKRRKQWKPVGLPKLTPIAKDLWRAIYREPWPSGWKVEWAGFMRGAMGLCSYGERRIILSYGDLFRKPQPLRVVVRGEHDEPIIEHYAVRGATGTRLIFAEAMDMFDGTRCPLKTLVHEFVHMRCGRSLRHGKEFRRLHAEALARAWEALS